MTASEEYAQAAGESPMKGAPVIDFDKFKPTRSMIARRKRKDAAMGGLISVAFIVALIPLFSVLWVGLSVPAIECCDLAGKLIEPILNK